MKTENCLLLKFYQYDFLSVCLSNRHQKSEYLLEISETTPDINFRFSNSANFTGGYEAARKCTMQNQTGELCKQMYVSPALCSCQFVHSAKLFFFKTLTYPL